MRDITDEAGVSRRPSTTASVPSGFWLVHSTISSTPKPASASSPPRSTLPRTRVTSSSRRRRSPGRSWSIVATSSSPSSPAPQPTRQSTGAASMMFERGRLDHVGFTVPDEAALTESATDCSPSVPPARRSARWDRCALGATILTDSRGDQLLQPPLPPIYDECPRPRAAVGAATLRVRGRTACVTMVAALSGQDGSGHSVYQGVFCQQMRR
jgi:hypothetical protein